MNSIQMEHGISVEGRSMFLDGFIELTEVTILKHRVVLEYGQLGLDLSFLFIFIFLYLEVLSLVNQTVLKFFDKRRTKVTLLPDHL